MATMDKRNEHEEDFGLIRPSLIKQLRSILDQYPDDGQILKELLQNAEDAKASKVKFLYDENTYGTNPQLLYDPGLAAFQGPALYAYNDGLFEEKDWKGIRMLQDSIKEKDPMKVGRFGLGFKSVLHMTDLPCVLSTDRMAIIDPHEKFFKYKGQKTTGYSWNLAQRKEELQRIPHQWEPFTGLFGCDKQVLNRGQFPGTIFRFPFRTKPSELSETVYTAQKMEELFESFIADAHLVLLFLKNVEEVELCVRKAGTGIKPVFKVQIAPELRQYVNGQRHSFRNKIQPGKWNAQPEFSTYPIVIECIRYEDAGKTTKECHRFLVCEHIAGGEGSPQLKTLSRDPNLSLVPLVGLAMSIGTNADAVDSIANGGDQSETQKASGHIFCFLPLPIEQKSASGLPVHVNGYFSVSQNRRHLKWPVAGQNVSNDKTLLWNKCLLQELIPRAYVKLLFQAIHLTRDPALNNMNIHPKDVVAAIPNLIGVDEKWQVLLQPFFCELFRYSIFYTKANSGKWVKADACLFNCLKENADTERLLLQVLCDCDVNVVTVPKYLLHALGAYSSVSPETITPSIVRCSLRGKHQAYQKLSREGKLNLLRYIVKDEDFAEMVNLELLPIANRQFVSLIRGDDTRRVYVPSSDHPRNLLPGLESCLIADDLDEGLSNKLGIMAAEGIFQLRHLKKEDMSKLIQFVIPKHWYQTKVVKWNPDNQHVKEPPKDWLENLWNYLRRYFPNDLQAFVGLPILPITADGTPELVRLALPSTTIVASALGSEMPKTVRSSLVCFDCHVIDDLPLYVQTHAATVGNYIRLPLPGDVFDAMFTATKGKGALVSQTIQQFKEKTTMEEKDALMKFLSGIPSCSLQPTQRQFLSMIPLFPVTQSANCDSSSRVSVQECSSAAPLEMSHLLKGQTLLDLSDPSAKRLAKHLGVEPMSSTLFLQKFVFSQIESKKMSSEETQGAMSYVLTNFGSLTKTDPTFLERLKTVPFVTNQEGRSHTPSQLFDPDNSALKNMFLEQDVFPNSTYANGDNLTVLKKLGLRGESEVRAKELVTSLAVLYKMSKKESANLEEVMTKAKAIWSHVNKFPNRMMEEVDGKRVADILRNVEWVPTLVEKPVTYPDDLPWPTEPALSRPCLMIPQEWCLAAGSVAQTPALPSSKQVAQVLGWITPPRLDLIVEQLYLVTKHYKPAEKAKYLGIIISIYDILSTVDSSKLQEALARKQLTSWVWTGEGFADLRRITLEKSVIDLRPYVFQLPSELLMFQQLFVKCGVTVKCTPTTLVGVLQNVQHKYTKQDTKNPKNTDTTESKTPASFPRSEVAYDRQLVIAVLNVLKSNHTLDEDLMNAVLFPIKQEENEHTTICMLRIQDCTYCDADWLRQGFDLMKFDEEDDIHLVHPDVPVNTAESLGVPTLMSRMLDAEELKITGFGQTEPLTNRLHRLLEDYTDGLAIPKELIQNADDAGAKEVRFLFDERANKDHMKYLIDEGMKECQGPCLWVYNDAVFTDSDFINITKLGGATKEQEVEKIGKFGLGFNAVYNVTDVPSFISRNNLVIFDPHTIHLGKGIRDRSKPGIKIDLQRNRTLIKKLPDQFMPYHNIFGCTIDAEKKNHFPGTLFRLPLRSKAQAARSEISNVHYDRTNMKELLKLLVKNASDLLLYTQSVSSVRVLYLSSEESDPSNAKELFSFNKETVKVLRSLSSRQSKHGAATDVNQHSGFLKACKAHYATNALATKRKESAPQEKPSMSLIIKTQVSIGDSARSFLDLPTVSSEHHWVVSSCFGQGTSLQMARQLEDEGLIPAAGVAAPVYPHEGGFTFSPPPELPVWKGRVFCYLPLPIETGLPVHINGHFAVQSNRRHLCEQTADDKQSKKVVWNQCFLSDAVCCAYIQMLQDFRRVVPVSAECEFFKCWPRFGSTLPYFKPLVTGFYELLVSMGDVPVIQSNAKMVSLGNGIFIDTRLTKIPVISKATIETFDLCTPDLHVINLPEEYVESFVRVGLANFVNDKTYSSTRFYQEIFFPSLKMLTPEIREPLVLFALDQEQPELNELLCSHPCVPTGAETARKPPELICPGQVVAKLYNMGDARFPLGEKFLTSKRLLALQKLGMVTDDLHWDDFLERARSIKPLSKTNPDAARNRLRILLSLLDKKLVQSRTDPLHQDDPQEMNHVQNEFIEIEFLPILRKPQNFPLPWKGEEYDVGALLSARDLQLMGRRYLVSATWPLVEEEQMTQEVKNFLRLPNHDVSVECVMTQFEHAMVTPPKKLYGTSSFEELQNTCHHIYDSLQGFCKSDPDIQRFLNAGLKDRECLLVDGKFLAPRQVACVLPADCSPYLYGLPAEMNRKYKFLMQVLEVREKFETEDYANCLQNLKSEFGEAPLKQTNLDLSLRLVSLMHSNMTQREQTTAEVEENCGAIYIPNAQGVLKPAKELCFNDCPWLSHTDSMSLNFTHPGVTFQTSASLGVKTKREEALSKHAKGIAFGQKERLTNSLKRVLNSYPFDQEILKELVQNADDAKAKEIHFIKDPRHHSDKHVFGESWKLLQGPALCVFNDQMFTEEDLLGIQRLGEGSKTNDPSRTGQYGIGFSSVYHLTDVPSIMTTLPDQERTLCVFDPNCSYIPGSSQNEPGMRYDDLGTLRQTFPDVFKCYLEDQKAFQSGTMFRFPLRNRAMVEKSQISKTQMTITKVQTLLDQFKREAFETLLFTSYLQKISISEIDIGTGNLAGTYTVYAELTDKAREDRAELNNYIQKVSKQLKNGEIQMQEVECREVAYEVILMDNAGVEEKWRVTQRVGFEFEVDVPDNIKHAFKQGELALLPRGGTACLLEKRVRREIVTPSKPNRAFCFLPLPIETGLPVHINGHFSLGYENRRHLWTNTESSSYKNDWNDFLCENVIAPCYLTLLKAIRMQGLNASVLDDAATVECGKGLLDSSLKAYQEYFPQFSETKPQWNKLVKAVYQYMAEQHCPVLPSSQELSCVSQQAGQAPSQQFRVLWLPPAGEGKRKAFFTKVDELEKRQEPQTSFFGKFKSIFSATTQSAKKTDAQILKEVLLDCGFKLLDATPSVTTALETAGVGIDYMSPDGVLNFLASFSSEHPMCNIGSLPAHLGRTVFRSETTLLVVMKYCKDATAFQFRLEGCPLLLTAGNTLKIFSTEDPVFVSKYHDLVPECKDRFMHTCLVDNIFNDKTNDDLDYFKPLNIEALAEMLPTRLEAEKYFQASGLVVWPKSIHTFPDEYWLKRLWSFLKDCVSTGADYHNKETAHGHILQKLQPLEQWSIIPAKTPERHYLVSLQQADEIMDFQRADYRHYSLRDVLRRLRIPELDSVSVNSSESVNSDIIQHFVTTVGKPVSVLKLLHKMFAGGAAPLPSLDECTKLLIYFNDECFNIETLPEETAEETKQMLRALPFFKTICGDLIQLTDCLVYVLPSKIPTDDIDVWQSKSGTVFLEHNDRLKDLFQFLVCASIDVSDVYCNFILQHFEYLSKEARTTHLRHVYSQYLCEQAPSNPNFSVENKATLLSTLRNLDFIEDKEGELSPASSFYDPEVVLFRVMLPEDKLPPRAGTLFRESEWLQFLRLLGLKSDVTEDMFVEFARLVEHEGKNAESGSALTKSKVLVEHLFKAPKRTRQKVSQDINDIRFVAGEQASTELKQIHPQYDGREEQSLPYISFKDSISKEYEKIVWTRAPLLPKWADPMNTRLPIEEKTDIMECLEIQKQPSLMTVALHLENLSESFDPNANQRQLLSVFRAIYAYIQEADPENDPDVMERLQRTPCVLVEGGKRLVKAKQTVLNMYEKEEIQPYLYRIPMEFGEFRELFTKLGSTEMATLDQYAMVLEELYQLTGDDLMLPHELQVAFKAVRGVFMSLENPQNVRINSQKLYLPSEKGCLVNAIKMVFNDAPSYYDRVRTFGIKFLVDLRECSLRHDNFEEILSKLPKKIKPSLLSALVKETLISRIKETVTSGGIAAQLSHRLTSEGFLQAIVRLVRHQCHRSGGKLEERSLYSITDRLSTIKVYGVEQVITHLVYNNKSVPGSEVEKTCFVEKLQTSGPDAWNIYIKNDGVLNQDLLIPLAEIVNSILSGVLNDSVLYLLPILACKDKDIESKLNALNVRLDHTQNMVRSQTLPVLGAKIPDTYHGTLREADRYTDGEYVGYQENSTDMLIYAKISNIVNRPGDVQYFIDTGSGSDHVSVEISRLRKFVR